MSRIGNIIKVPDLRNKVLFTLMMPVLYRFGSFIARAGHRPERRGRHRGPGPPGWRAGVLQLFSVGPRPAQPLASALGIMPLSRRRSSCRDPGRGDPHAAGSGSSRGQSVSARPPSGPAYVTIGISILQSTGLVFLFTTGAVASPAVSPTWTWCRASRRDRDAHRAHLHRRLGAADVDGRADHHPRHRQRRVADHLLLGRVGSAVSVLRRLRRRERSCEAGVFIAFFLVLLVFIVFIELGQRRIPVQFAKRVVGRRMYSGRAPTSRSRSTRPA